VEKRKVGNLNNKKKKGRNDEKYEKGGKKMDR